jgi:hypothetical protein
MTLEPENATLRMLREMRQEIRQQLTRIEHDLADLRDQFIVQVALTTRLQNSIDRLKVEVREVNHVAD